MSTGVSLNTGVPCNTGILLNTGVSLNTGVPCNTGILLNTGVSLNTGVPWNVCIHNLFVISPSTLGCVSTKVYVILFCVHMCDLNLITLLTSQRSESRTNPLGFGSDL